jgi:DDE superfamily endonuclease.
LTRYEQGFTRQMIQDGNREWIMVLACVCADGTSLSPGLIYKAAPKGLQDMWLQAFDPDQDKYFFTSSPSGWINDEVGYRWLIEIFDRETKAKAGRSWRLLILDGHNSHTTKQFIDYCDRNRNTPITLSTSFNIYFVAA